MCDVCVSQDWCVSRQLWWGHRIPVWYVHDSQEAADTAEEGRSDRYAVCNIALCICACSSNSCLQLFKPSSMIQIMCYKQTQISRSTHPLQESVCFVACSCRYVVARNASEAAAKAAGQWGEGLVLVQEPDVLDTWFSSGLWPFSTLGWPNENAQDLKTFYPTQVWLLLASCLQAAQPPLLDGQFE